MTTAMTEEILRLEALLEAKDAEIARLKGLIDKAAEEMEAARVRMLNSKLTAADIRAWFAPKGAEVEAEYVAIVCSTCAREGERPRGCRSKGETAPCSRCGKATTGRLYAPATPKVAEITGCRACDGRTVVRGQPWSCSQCGCAYDGVRFAECAACLVPAAAEAKEPLSSESRRMLELGLADLAAGRVAPCVVASESAVAEAKECTCVYWERRARRDCPKHGGGR